MKRDPGALFFRPISDHFLYADWIEDTIWGIPSFRITTGKFWTTPIWRPEVFFLFFFEIFICFMDFENKFAGQGFARPGI